MGKKKNQPTEAVLSMRRTARAERIDALRDGRVQRGWRIPNGRAVASKRACRGRHDG